MQKQRRESRVIADQLRRWIFLSESHPESFTDVSGADPSQFVVPRASQKETIEYRGELRVILKLWNGSLFYERHFGYRKIEKSSLSIPCAS